MPPAGPPLFLAGPTASGKSEIALLLAERFGGEIISVDSMQVYRGLDIGTAKPTPEERRGVPHHLVDVADLQESFDAARFVRLARQAVEEINARGRWPLFVGGTGLYFKAYLEGLGESPPADAALRAQLERVPLAELLRELAESDPPAFERIDSRNPRRVVRAIEVIRLTGRRFSEQRAPWSPPDRSSGSAMVLALDRDPEELRARIDARVDWMFEKGLIRETEELLARGLEQNRVAMQAIGYRQVVEQLRNKCPQDQTVALVKQRTRQFARRQRTWLRHQLPVEWIAVAPAEQAANVAARIQEKLGLSSTSASTTA